MAEIVLKRERLQSLRTRRTELEGTRDRLNDELDRLRDARNSFLTELSDYGSLTSEVPRALSSIDTSRFRGNNRSRKRDQLRIMRDHLESLRVRHQDNCDLVRAQIRTHEDDLGTVRGRLNTVNLQITNLENDIRSMMT